VHTGKVNLRFEQRQHYVFRDSNLMFEDVAYRTRGRYMGEIYGVETGTMELDELGFGRRWCRGMPMLRDDGVGVLYVLRELVDRCGVCAGCDRPL
jgi:hypothetical protein